MALAEGQFEIRGLAMGPGTRFRITDDTNPWVRQTRADQSGGLAWGHGGWSGAEWSAERVISFGGLIGPGRDDVAGALEDLHDLAAAFAPTGVAGDVPMRWRQGGREYLAYVRTRMTEPRMDLLGTGRVWVRCAAVALDPFIYSAVERTAGPLGGPTWSGGLTFPMTVPFTIGATQTGGAADLVNEGRAPASLTIRYDGPLPGDNRIAVRGPDGVTRVQRVVPPLAAGEWLEVDTRARTVWLNGDQQSSRRSDVVGDWPLLLRGTSVLRHLAPTQTAGTVTVRWRDTWW
ncbi:hypothetical protein AWW66_03280 [Micromonospora rosaria]|uniref:Siphovirus-type tail component C-terminal domain-containing protein n=1 Tax=Micromonospora rosaria TaxID=47874 RepID=A0A136PXZ4_9ACTN|nr:hypothetical protein [Micromonospora rosaria]KXK63349.1 hypothetical protein AWW66_03280 [Micromonospora rosaria]